MAPAKLSLCFDQDCPVNRRCARFLDQMNDPKPPEGTQYVPDSPYDHGKQTCRYYIAGSKEFQGKSTGGRGTTSKLRQFIEAVVDEIHDDETQVRRILVHHLRKFKIHKAHLQLEEPKEENCINPRCVNGSIEIIGGADGRCGAMPCPDCQKEENNGKS